MAEIDYFDDDWETSAPGKVPLNPVNAFAAVPLSKGLVAFRLETLEARRSDNVGRELQKYRSQNVVTPEYAREMAALLIAAANKVSKSN